MNWLTSKTARWAFVVAAIAGLVFAVGAVRTGQRNSAAQEAARLQVDERVAYDRLVVAEGLASQARSDARDRVAAVEADRLAAIQKSRDAAAAQVQAARQAQIDIEDRTSWRNHNAFMGRASATAPKS